MNDRAGAYLETRDCLLAIRVRIDDLTSGVDPASWYVASPAALPGDNETPNVRQMAIYARANVTFFRAMLIGALNGWFVDGGERWQIPGWAWADQGGDWRALIMGNDFLHPLAPPEVRRWAWLPVQVERAEFMRWLDSDEIADQTGFPKLPPAYDEASRPPYVTRLEPPDRPNVSLAHALSWLAFGISMDARNLASALGAGVLGASRIDAQRRLEQATDRLVTAGTGGLPMLGKFVPMHGDYGAALTARIEPERLEDFRQFDVTFDGLRYGTGVSWDWTDPGVTTLARALPATTHRFVDVKVERRTLVAFSEKGKVFADGSDGSGNSPRLLNVGRSGRTPGSGSYASADAPLLAEMADHIASGKAMSPHAAAQIVADRASGGGSFNSKVTWLAKAFRSLERNGVA